MPNKFKPHIKKDYIARREGVQKYKRHLQDSATLDSLIDGDPQKVKMKEKHIPAQMKNPIKGKLLCPAGIKIDPYDFCTGLCTYCFAIDVRQSFYSRLFDGWEKFDVRPANMNEFNKVIRSIMSGNDNTILGKSIRGRGYVQLGVNTDAFQPAENKHRITEQMLRTFSLYRIPVSISTKFTLYMQEPWFSLLNEMYDRADVVMLMSLSVLDEAGSKMIEPGVPNIAKRVMWAKQLVETTNIPIGARFIVMPERSEEQIIADIDKLANDFTHIQIRSLLVSGNEVTIQSLQKATGINYRNWFKRYGAGQDEGCRWRERMETLLPKLIHAKEHVEKMNNGTHLGFNSILPMYSMNDGVHCCGVFDEDRLYNKVHYKRRACLQDLMEYLKKHEGQEVQFEDYLGEVEPISNDKETIDMLTKDWNDAPYILGITATNIDVGFPSLTYSREMAYDVKHTVEWMREIGA